MKFKIQNLTNKGGGCCTNDSPDILLSKEMFFDKQMNQSICQSFVSLIYDTVDLKTLLNGSLTFHRLTIGWQLLKTIKKGKQIVI